MVMNNENLTSLDELLDTDYKETKKTFDVQTMNTFDLMALFTDIECDFTLRVQVIHGAPGSSP